MNDESRVWIRARKCRKRTSYHLRWIDPVAHKWRSRKAGTDRRVAERMAAALEDELTNGTYREVRRIPWAEFAKDHVAKIPGKPDATDAERTLRAFASFRSTNVANRFRAIVEAAGIARCTFHDLRRTFCTDLARLGVNQLVVQKLAGHASASTTAKYYQHVDDAMKRDAIAKLKRRSAG